MSGSMPPPAAPGGAPVPPQMLQAIIARLTRVPGALPMMQQMLARGPTSGGAPPQPGPPGGQVSPQMLAAMMAQRQQQGAPQAGAMPPRPMPPGGAPMPPAPPPQGSPMGIFAQAAQQRPQGPPPSAPPPGMAPQQAAAMGRGGDTILSHLQPGEIVINPKVLPPHLVQAIMQAFQQAGVDPRAMVVGQGPRNPATGLEEHNSIFDSLLPALLGVGGAVLAPEALPMLGLDGTLGAGAASAIGGGLGSAAGTAIGGGNMGQALTSGLGSAAGNALLGGLGGAGNTLSGNPTSAPPGVGGSGAPTTAPFGSPAASQMAAQYAQGDGQASLLGNPMPGGAMPSGVSDPSAGNPWMRGLGAGLGGVVGAGLAPSMSKLSLPQGSIPYYNPKGPNPVSGAPGRPTFTNYNPFASVTQQPYNFFPTS